MEIFLPVSDSLCSPLFRLRVCINGPQVHSQLSIFQTPWSGCAGQLPCVCLEGSAPTTGADFVLSLLHIRAVPSSAWLDCSLSNSDTKMQSVEVLGLILMVAGTVMTLAPLHGEGVPPTLSPSLVNDAWCSAQPQEDGAGSFLVSSGWHNRRPQPGGFSNTLTPHTSAGQQVQDQGASRLFLVRALFLSCRWWFLIVSSHGRDREKALWYHFLQGTNPIMGALPSWPHLN